MTLVELVIGIGLSIILIYIVFPIAKIENHNVEYFARQLVSDIRYIRTINMNGNLNLHIEQTPSTDPPYYTIKDNSNIIKTINLPKGSKLTSPSNIIKFKSDGTLSTKGETITITLNKLKLEITIVPFSGRVLLKEGKYAS